MSRTDAFALVAGGTVQAGGGVYLPRRADDGGFQDALGGAFRDRVATAPPRLDIASALLDAWQVHSCQAQEGD